MHKSDWTEMKTIWLDITGTQNTPTIRLDKAAKTPTTSQNKAKYNIWLDKTRAHNQSD
jgi:hypothetical protein